MYASRIPLIHIITWKMLSGNLFGFVDKNLDQILSLWLTTLDHIVLEVFKTCWIQPCPENELADQLAGHERDCAQMGYGCKAIFRRSNSPKTPQQLIVAKQQKQNNIRQEEVENLML